MVPFSLKETPLKDKAIWKCSKTRYSTLLQADLNDLIFQQNGAPPYWHLSVGAYPNKNVSQ